MMFTTYDNFCMNNTTRHSMVYNNYIYEAVLDNFDHAVFENSDSHMGMIGFKGTRRARIFPTPHNADEASLNQQSRPKLVLIKSREVTIAVASNGSFETSNTLLL
ncbi:MAG: DUF1329 domain-containing protein [Candidatus Reddybacter sp.]